PRRDHDLVTRTDTPRPQCALQRKGAIGKSNRASHSQIPGVLALELSAFLTGPVIHRACGKDGVHRLTLIGFETGPCRQISELRQLGISGSDRHSTSSYIRHVFLSRAGTPTTVAPARTSFTQTAPAPTVTSSPIRMPWRAIAPIPNHTRAPSS